MSNKKEVAGKVYFSQGYYIEGYLEEVEKSISKLSEELEEPEENLIEVIKEGKSLGKEALENLSKLLGTSEEMWLNIQKKYEEEGGKERCK